MLRHLSFASLAALTVVFTASVSLAHVTLSNPPARYPAADNQKTGPCGSGTATGDVTAYTGGDTITVEWDETVNHTGHFRIALDMTGADAYDEPESENDMVVDGNIVAFVDDNGGAQFSHTFTLPDVDCDPCSIQLMQVMTDKLPWGPANGDDLYYRCADITIAKSQVGTGGAGGAAGVGGTGGNAAATTGQGGAGGMPGATSSTTGATTGSGETGGNFGTPVPSDDSGCSTTLASGGPSLPDSNAVWLSALIGAVAWSRRRGSS